MRMLLPWRVLQEAMAARLDADLVSTSLNGKIYNYIPQEIKYPFLFFGEMESTDNSAKSIANLSTIATVDIYSGEAGNQQCQDLCKSVLASLTATSLVLSGGEFRSVGPGQFVDPQTIRQEYDGVGVVWVGRLRVAFLTQQI